MDYPRPVLGFAAFSGTGKTTLLVRLIPHLQAQGLRVAVIKHAHHDFDTDLPGKDSYELRRAGARQVLVASERRQALITENVTPAEPQLGQLVGQIDPQATDLVLVEGFRHVPFPKIELHRPSLGRPLLFRRDDSIIAVASDERVETAGLPLINLNDTDEIGRFISNRIAS